MTVSELVRPAYAHLPPTSRTLGDEVGDLARLAGFGPSPEQQMGLDAMFALDDAGRTAAFEFCVVCSRQNLKTGLFMQAALGWLYITDQRLVIWSAHLFDTAQEAFHDMTALVESSHHLSRRVKQIRRGNGDEAIEMTGGQRLIFKARSRGGGRGLTGDKVVLDEAYALRPMHMGALLPTLSARPDPQVVYGSSAGMADSDVLRRLRDRGRAGTSKRLAYLEWCSQVECESSRCTHEPGAPGCALDDPGAWQQANPSLGRPVQPSITLDYLHAERQALDPAEFARERLGRWDDPADAASVFGPGRWEACRVTDDGPPPKSGWTLGLAVSVDRSHASVGAAVFDDDRLHVGSVLRTEDIGEAVTEVTRISEERDATVVVDSRGPAADLVDDLREAGVHVLTTSMSEFLDACAAFYDRVQAGTLAHVGDAELDAAAFGAAWRPVGDRRAWARKTSRADVSMLEAVTLAAWAADSGDVLESVY